MSEQNIAVWVSDNISHAQEKELFLIKKNIFKKSFYIKEESDFFDDEHMIIIYPQIGGKPSSLDEVKSIAIQYAGLSECWNNIEESIKKENIEKINYLLAIPEFKYSGRIKKTDNLLFLGNFSYTHDTSYLDEFFK